MIFFQVFYEQLEYFNQFVNSLAIRGLKNFQVL